jgi:AcrR family transcriptional regulator
MAKPRQPVEVKRRIPRQERAEWTVEAIMEGAAQILEDGGLAAFTTNAVAERAGVSIGTLYQYFADKNALLVAIARREVAATLTAVGRVLQNKGDMTIEERTRGMVRVILNAFRGRQRARKAMVQAIFAQGIGAELMSPVVAFTAALGAGAADAPALSREQAFVLSRALMGAIRAAVIEEQPFFKSRAFEDELVRLVLAYLGAIKASR